MRPSIVLAVGVLVLGLLAAATSTPPDQPAAYGQITPLLAGTLATPRWFTGTDGEKHLVYELLLTNVVPAAVTLNAVDVHDADSGVSLIRLTGDSLRAATSLAASAETPTVTLPPSSIGVIWMDIALGSHPVPAAITHRVAIDPPADIPTSDIAWNFTGPAVAVDQEPPTVIGPPLAGPDGSPSAAAVTVHITVPPI